MLKTSSLECLLTRQPTKQSSREASDVRIKEAADLTRSKITGAFHGAVKIKAKIKIAH